MVRGEAMAVWRVEARIGDRYAMRHLDLELEVQAATVVDADAEARRQLGEWLSPDGMRAVAIISVERRTL
jgi:hypothetical protein